MLINPPGTLDANALKTGFNAQLRARAHLREIYTNLKGLYNKTTQAIPNAIYMYLDDEVSKGANSLRVTLKQPITGGAVEGNTRMVGTEVPPTVKTVTFYRNNWGKAVPVETYGVNKLDQEYLGIYEQHIDDLGPWAEQYRGRSIRTAFLERHSPNLLVGNTAAACTAEWNPHFYVAGCPDRDQPVYSSNMTTYTNRIVESIIIASGGTIANPTYAQTVNATFGLRFVNNLIMAAQNRHIAPLDIGGNQAYILTISTLQAAMTSDPTWKTDGMGAIWTTAGQLQNKEIQNWYGLLGMLRVPAGADVYIVVDPKQPTLLPTGSGYPTGLRAGYMLEGDIDDRNLTNPRVRDTAFLHGKMSIACWEPEKMHFVEHDEEYARIMGRGIKGVWGYSLPIFDQQNPAATSREYYGGMVGVLSRPSYL